MSQIPIPSHSPDLSKTKRFLVIVPPGKLDPIDLGRLIHDLCRDKVKIALLLTVVRDVDDHLRMDHFLKKLASVAHDCALTVETNVQVGIPWLQAIRSVSKPDDEIICFEEHWIPWHLFWKKPIGEILVAEFKKPIHILSTNGRD